MAERKAQPIAIDRHFKLPIFRQAMEDAILGEHTKYNLATDHGRRLAELRTLPEYINVNTSVPQSSKDGDENIFQRIIKHELVHALQSRMDDKNQRMDRGAFRAADLNPFSSGFWSPTYQDKLRHEVGNREADAYTLSNTVDLNKSLPLDAAYQEIIRQRQLQRLRDLGLVKESKIWE